jgi:hypothetical protein
MDQATSTVRRSSAMSGRSATLNSISVDPDSERAKLRDGGICGKGITKSAAVLPEEGSDRYGMVIGRLRR